MTADPARARGDWVAEKGRNVTDIFVTRGHGDHWFAARQRRTDNRGDAEISRPGGRTPTPEFTGDFEEVSLLAGESVGQTKRLMSVADIIDEMMNGAEVVIRKRLGSIIAGQ
jgi:glyoxylase-like metal-dependent hydrolase (beta-lactamase superfamily II)